ncbi:MAG: DNA primase [Methylophilaceae bacterium]|nr:DNA primase [Methylophilaceae bacterium]
MPIPQHFIQELLDRVDLVDVIDRVVPLKKAGANYVACCPFHREKTPSFTVSPTKQFYHCFGCGAHGTAIGFLMEHQGLGFIEAVEDLARRVGLKVPRESSDRPVKLRADPDMLDVMQRAANYYRSQLKRSERAIAYLKGRGVSGEIAARFQIGYAPSGWQNLREVFSDYESVALTTAGLTIRSEEGRVYDRFRDRVMFPIHDQRGHVIGFGGRILEGAEHAGPKYLNSPETVLFQKGQELYGLFLARRAIREAGRVVVVEGYMDAVALTQHGIEYVVATLGTATTSQQITKLVRHVDDVVFCFDGDPAGRGAAWRAMMNALPMVKDGLKLSFLFLPPEHDPDSYVRAFGQEGFEDALKNAVPLSVYLIREISTRHDLTTQEGRVRLLNDAQPLLQQIQAPGLGLLLRKRIAELAGVTQAELESLLKLGPSVAKPRLESQVARQSPVLTRELLKLLLFRPSLATRVDVSAIPPTLPQMEVVRYVIETVLAQPDISSAALLESLRVMASEKLCRYLTEQLMTLDAQTFDIESEFQALMNKLERLGHSGNLASILEKPLHQLTEQEKALLRNYRRSAEPK